MAGLKKGFPCATERTALSHPDAPAFFLIYTFVLLIGALVVLIPGLDLIPVIVGSQNLQGLLLPIVLVFMVLLVNDDRLHSDRGRGRRYAKRHRWRMHVLRRAGILWRRFDNRRRRT